MAWWQKKLLRYALSRTGFLDDNAIDLDNLDVAFGRQNVFQFKDVGLNIKRISKLAQLPPSLRVETARVLSLRLIVPADIYQSSIIAEVDGVELSLRLDQQGQAVATEKQMRPRSPVTTRSPQHRKVHRRLHSPPPYDPDGLAGSDEHLPTTQEMAKSFLMDEPMRERIQLEASVAAQTKGMDESIASESSEGTDYGTGAGVGVPGFLAGFLQGIVNRLQIKVSNVNARLETELPGDGAQPAPVTLHLRVEVVEVTSQAGQEGLEAEDMGEPERAIRRRIQLSEIHLNLLSDADIFSELSELPPRSPSSTSRHHSSGASRGSSRTAENIARSRPSTADSHRSFNDDEASHPQDGSPDALRASILTADSDRFADAGDEGFSPTIRSQHSDLDIQPGDDNISWGSRRSQSNAPAQDLWNSMASKDDLPDSLLLDRATTPRPSSPRSGSPAVTRTRRTVSPYSRQLQSPGSWPRMDESHEALDVRQSPGSWPNLEQSRQSLSEAPAEPSSEPDEPEVDNRQAALDVELAEPSHDIEPEEDLAASRVFSHDEAESMFMSAMSQRCMHVPGGWGADTTPSEASRSPSRSPAIKPVATAPPVHNKTADDDLAYGELFTEPAVPRSEQVTPRAGSPALPAPQEEAHSHTVEKNILDIDSVLLWLPNGQSESQEPHAPQRPASRAASDSFAPTHMPGTFSAYSEMAASRRQRTTDPMRESSIRGSVLDTFAESAKANDDPHEQNMTVEVGAIASQIDIPCGRLLYRMGLQASTVMQAQQKPPPRRSNADASSHRADPTFNLSVATTKLVLKEHVGPMSNMDQRQGQLLAFAVYELKLSSQSGDLDARIGAFETSLGANRLLSFDKTRQMQSSIVVSERTPDVAFTTITNRAALGARLVKTVNLETMPIDLALDLGAFDETFSSFGGLSGVLEAGNSMLSDSGIMSTPSSPKVAKGVRFEGAVPKDDATVEVKLNARVGGIAGVLRGESCSVQLRTTTLKVVYREQGISATIEHTALSGPHARNSSSRETEPISIELYTARLEYFTSPHEKDLDRLISLLTPSKDKYDTEDDILIDTLLRQRRKGGVARVSLGSVKAKVDDWDHLSTLQAMSNEFSKLTAVAKYLPEDDRPGILSLIRVKEIETGMPVNDRFGKVHVNVGDLHLAHVGLPALLALSIGTVHASQNDQANIVHSLLPNEILPMVMMRMLGDEIEPVVKVKLFNICVAYSVPVLVAATGLDDEADRDEVVTELAKSVAELALPDKKIGSRNSSPANSSPSPAKKMKIDLLVHDSAIGLQPQHISSKGMLVLADAHFSTTVPPEATVTASIQLRKAAIFIADDVSPGDAEQALPSRNAPSNSATGAKLTLALSQRGFVSVGSIHAATIDIKAAESATGEGRTLDVDVRNELLLLETCADSTQTLIAVLNGLSPPTPPSKQPKYLTEPMTIEDMMASFTGEPQAKQDEPPEMMSDAEAEQSEGSDDMLDMAGFDEDDDGLLAESELEASLYGPVSGMLEGVDKPEDEDEANVTDETAQSLLDDDPFEMPDIPENARLSDAALMRELRSQCKPAVSEQPIDLGLYEVEDLGFDALGGGQQPLGGQHRFNTPASRKRPLGSKQAPELPFKLRLKDLHIIWNTYDGYDWKRTREGITEAVEQVEMRAEERKAKRRQSQNDREEEEPVIEDFLFNSIYIGVPNAPDAQELRRHINRGIDDLASETESVPMSGMSRPTTAYSASGRPLRQRQRRRLKLERSRAHKVAFELKGVSADVLMFPPDHADTVSSIDVRVKDFTIFDHVPSSTWRKFLTQQVSDPAAREMSKPMMHIELFNVKTLEQYAASEIVMHVAVMPVRLHVDQDALDFITRLFEFKDESTAGAGEANEQPFIQRIEVDTVDMCLDYKPKRVDYGGIRSGHYTEFKNFVILDGANIKLKHAIVYGIKGFEPLHQTLNDVWMPDIKRNQLPTVLAGLAPVRSLVNIGSGVRDVVAIPVREYKKDGRVVRSIQKGAMHFGKTTTSELARLGAKVAMGTQTFLTGAEGMLSPGTSSPSGRSPSGRTAAYDYDQTSSDDDAPTHRAISAYANQPLGIFSGLRSARHQLELDLLTAKDALIAVQGEMFESGTPGSAAAAVARHAPTVILRPVIGASRAVGTALLGVGNQIDRGGVRRVEDKYKRR